MTAKTARKTAEARYFDTFFAEKEITSTTWDITDDSGVVHIIDTDYVIAIIKATDGDLARKIRADLVRIDFANGDVVRYLHHIAKGYISTYFAAKR